MVWHLIKGFPTLAWVVILGTFMVRIGYFMVWPFLAILLYQNYALAASQIGLLLGASAALSTLVAFYGGWLSDRFGRRNVLLMGCWFAVFSFALLGISHSLLWLSVAVLSTGVALGLVDPPSKALLVESLNQPKARELALHMRYFVLNVSAAVGPLVGALLNINTQQPVFIGLAFTYLLLALAYMWGFAKCTMATVSTPAGQGASLAQALAVLMADRAFLLLVLANLLMMLVYSQFHSPFVQYLTQLAIPNVAQWVATLVAINAIIIVILQFPLLALLSGWSSKVKLQCGIALFLVAQLVFAWASPAHFSHWVVAVLLLSIGEAILFPLINVLIDQMAPAHLKGSYFGAAALAGFGNAFGAWSGGWLLSHYSGLYLYLLMALLCLMSFWLYQKSHQRLPLQDDKSLA